MSRTTLSFAAAATLVACHLTLVPSAALSQDAAVLKLGQETYQTCATCHGPDGKGMKAGNLLLAPSLLESAYVKGEHADLIAAAVMKGILKEDNKYVQVMVPQEAILNDEQIAAVVTYVLKEYGGKKTTVKPQDVAGWKKDYASQKVPFKRDALDALRKQAELPPFLTDVRYKIYEGSFKKVADVIAAENGGQPTKEGVFKNHRISLDPAKAIKKGFGMIVDAKMTLAKKETVEFALGSNDGSILAINGEGLINVDGVHPHQVKKAKEDLEPGEHTLRVVYFEAGGQRSLALGAQSKSLGKLQLSKMKIGGGGGGQSYEPILLTAPSPNEAIVHRAFLPNAKPRAIGVGYPGQVNVCWDADVLNVAYIWRGAFMDAAKHWNGRGSGSQPLGQDTVKVAHGMPFQVLESMDEPWVPFSEAKIRYERDKADSQKEITFNLKHPDYQFRGYRLDENRFPTFRFDYQDLEVTDRFEPADVEGVKALVRHLSTSGKAKENTYFRISENGSLAEEGGWYDVGGNLKVKVEGAEAKIRQIGNKKELVAPITGDAKLTLTYRWNEAFTPGD